MDSEAATAAAVTEAASAGEPLLVQGNGTKAAMLRPVQAARMLSTRDLCGITLYSPKELIISARAGTPLPVIEAALAESGQHLIAEPPTLSLPHGPDGTEAQGLPQTLGGVVATNLSGPRRVAWGAMRDHVMGVRMVNGRGEIIHAGGRVLKNVTGLDLCKLLSGSHGTLGVITEVTLKVLPAPESSGTVVLPAPDPASGVAALSAALGSPYGVSAAAWLPADAAARLPSLAPMGCAVALMRIEDVADSVRYRTERLRAELGGEVIGDDPSRAVWRAVRDAEPLWDGAPGAAAAVWRVSVRPSAGPAVLAIVAGSGITRGFLDWGGGLVWLAGRADTATHQAVESAARASGGTWTLMAAPATLRSAVRVVPDEPPALAAITRRVKAALDPRGILNPGRIYAGL